MDEPMIIKSIMYGHSRYYYGTKYCVDAIVVSNHGGRQLDDATSSILVLKEIIVAVDSKLEVLIDSGIRSGQDLLKAKALSATAGLIGRAMVYGVGTYGKKVHKEY